MTDEVNEGTKEIAEEIAEKVLKKLADSEIFEPPGANCPQKFDCGNYECKDPDNCGTFSCKVY